MGHYSDYYAHEKEKEEKREKAELEIFLDRLNEIARGSKEYPGAPSLIFDELKTIRTKIQSRLYELRYV